MLCKMSISIAKMDRIKRKASPTQWCARRETFSYEIVMVGVIEMVIVSSTEKKVISEDFG